MVRPRKYRRICSMPLAKKFGPLDLSQPPKASVVMTVDEFETIRLIDLDGLSQEECAKRMGIARTTAQAIYGNARFKLAEGLVCGKKLLIEGGDVVICDGDNNKCPCNCCRKKQCQKQNNHNGDESK